MIMEEVRKQIESVEPMKIISYADFSELSEQKITVAKELSNLFKKGILRRISKGMYYKPAYSRFGELPPADTDILMKYLELSTDKIGYISGTNVYRGMGLTTQLSKEFVIVNDTRQGAVNIQNIRIKFIKTPVKTNEELNESDFYLLCILDALLDIKSIPSCTPSRAVTMISNLVAVLSEEKKQRLYTFSLSYRPMVKALLGLIFERIGEKRLSSQLKSTLNPLTKFQVGLNSSLSGNQWNIL